MESNFSVIKNLVIGGTLTKKDLLKDLNSNYISENVKKENKKFEKVVNQKEDIVSFLSELVKYNFGKYCVFSVICFIFEGYKNQKHNKTISLNLFVTALCLVERFLMPQKTHVQL